MSGHRGKDDELLISRLVAVFALGLAAVFDIYALWPVRSKSALCAGHNDASVPFLFAALALVVVAGVIRPRLGGWMWLAFAVGVGAVLLRLAAGLSCIG
jgi:hypothetical protein